MSRAPNPRASASACWPPAAGASPLRTTSRREGIEAAAGTRARDRPRRPLREEEGRRAGARSAATRPSGLRPSASIPSPFRWTGTSPCCSPWTASCGATPACMPGRSLHGFRAAAAGLRLHPRQRHRPDALPPPAPASPRSATRTARSSAAPIPNSFGGQYQLKGYELVDELRLVENAPRVAEEAVALHSADQCPEGAFDLMLDSSQLALQIHESIGHPIELDRVLGSEANYAGMSFLTLDKLRQPALRLGDRQRGVRRAPRARPRPGHLRLRRRRRAGAVHRHHPQRPLHRLHDLARDRGRRRRDALERHACAPTAGPASRSSA